MGNADLFHAVKCAEPTAGTAGQITIFIQRKSLPLFFLYSVCFVSDAGKGQLSGFAEKAEDSQADRRQHDPGGTAYRNPEYGHFPGDPPC